MTSKTSPDRDHLNRLDKNDPNYWVKAFAGKPMSIVVPPYIRFLQGTLVIRKAMVLLREVQVVSLVGHPQLSPIFNELEQSPDTRKLGLNYETFFSSHLTINLVSEVEQFIGSAVAAALRMHPQKMGAHTFKLLDILSATSTDELIERAASAVLNDIMYERPQEYIKRLATILSIDSERIQTTWRAFVELKARRDIGIHGNWVVNEIYLRKVREVGIDSNYRAGDHVVPDFGYLIRAADSCDELVEAMVGLLAEKWLPPNERIPPRNPSDAE